MTDPRCCGICKRRHGAMCRATDRTWPMQPLAETARAATGLRDAAKALGISGQSFAAYMDHGIPDQYADLFAIKLGRHPAQVWGAEWIEAGLSVVDAQRLAGGWRPAWEWAETLRGSENHTGVVSAPEPPTTARVAGDDDLATNAGTGAAA